jgi:hypothetical protein
MGPIPPAGGLDLEGPATAYWDLANWVRTSRLQAGDRSVFEHEVLCRVQHAMATYDQLNMPSLKPADLISRRKQLIKSAHSVNPTAPDYSAANEFMGWGASRGSNAVSPTLQHYVAQQVKSQADIMKETRKAREGRAAVGGLGRRGRRGRGGLQADQGQADA